jgi:acetyl-CoA hydrolase
LSGIPTASADALDLTAHLRAGDVIAWPGVSAEPVTLTRLLDRDAAKIGALSVFFSLGLTENLRPAPALRVLTLGGGGTNRRFLPDAGNVVLAHYSELERLIATDRLRIDVVFLQVTPPDAHSRCNAGIGIDFVGAALERARLVIAEANSAMPWTEGDTTVAPDHIDLLVPSARPLIELPSRPPSAIERAVAENVARLIPDRATLQFGLGAIPDAMPAVLAGKRGLGIHSGLIGDGVLDLIEAGIVDNRHKEIDPDVTVTMMLAGTARLYRWADRNPRLAVRRPSYTHGAAVLAQLRRLVAVNSALEIDLTGQVNAETIDRRYAGFVGGQVDFARAAEGRSILALPSTTRDRKTSRIVARLADGVVTTARSDADTVVTEHGIAELTGLTLAERARAMIAIADPAFRDGLAAAADRLW